MFSLSDTMDTLAGFGASIADTAASTIHDAAAATVNSINQTIANAGKPSSAVPESHQTLATGQNSNGSTVVPAPTTAPVAHAAAALPMWVKVLAGVSALALVGGGVYVAVKK